MATSLQTIRRLTVEGRTVGVNEATASLTALSRAQTSVAQTADGMAVATERSSKRQLSLASAVDRQRMSDDLAFKMRAQAERAMRTYDAALNQGILTLGEHAAAQERVRIRYGASGQAAEQMGRSIGLARHEMINLGRQTQDVVTMYAMGAPVMQIFTSQFAQVIDIFASSQGTLRGFGSQLAAMVTPARALTVGFAGLGLGVYAAYSSWKTFALQLDDTSRITGVATRELSALQAAASFKGIQGSDFNDAMGRFSQAVYDANTNMGSLSTLLRANRVYVKDFAGSFEAVANLVQNARSDQQRLVLLQQAGLPATMEWVRLLSNGADGLKRGKAEAAEFAANDNMIQSARRFDEAWNKAWTNFGLNMRSSFQSAIEWSTTFMDRMQRYANRIGNLGIWSRLYSPPTSAQVSGLGLTEVSPFASRFDTSSNPAASNAALADGLRARADRMRNVGTIDPAELQRLINLEQQRLSVLSGMQTVGQQVRAVELAIAQARHNHVEVSAKEEENLKRLVRERALGIDQINAQSDAYRIQADVMGMSVGQAAAYAAWKTKELEAIRSGAPLRESELRDLREKAEIYGRLAQANAVRSLQDRVQFESATMFMSPSEQRIAQEMRSIYNDQWRSQMNGALASQMRMNDLLRDYGSIASSSFVTFGQNIRNGQNAMEALKNAGLDALGKISDKLLQMAADDLLGAALGRGRSSSGGGILGLLGGLFGGGSSVGGGTGYAVNPWSSAGILGSSRGNVFMNGRIIPHANGGIIDRPIAFGMAGGNIGTAAEDKPEAIMPLKRGRDGKLGVAASGEASGGVVVHLGGVTIDARGAQSGVGEEIEKAMASFVRGPVFQTAVSNANIKNRTARKA